MSFSIAVPSTNNKPAVMVSQQHGAFTIEPVTDAQIIVKSKNGLLINGLLYPFTGRALQHSEGDWRFWAQSLDGLKQVAPKVRIAVLEKLTHEVNEYMEARPDIMKVLVIRSWESTTESLRSDIRRMQTNMVMTQQSITQYQTRIDNEAKMLEELQQKLAEHLASPPPELGPNEVEAEAEAEVV